MKDVGLTQANANEGGEAQNSPSSHLVWDSTFEAIKTLETSMKLMLTPSTSKTKSRIPKANDSQGDEAPLINSQTRGSTSSVASTVDENTPNESNTSNTSNVSLTWDNSCEILESKDDIIVTSDYKKKDLTASDTSMDIDEIITRVAPNLSRCDMDTIENIDEIETETLRPSQTSKVGDILDRNCHLRNFDRFSNVVSSPLLHQTVYVSVTNLDDCEDDDDQVYDFEKMKTMNELRSLNQLQSSPNNANDPEAGGVPDLASQLPSPIQFSLTSSATSSMLNVPGSLPLSLSASPVSELGEYLSVCSSQDSFKTIINDDTT